jgi:signal transduction histidine kinase
VADLTPQRGVADLMRLASGPAERPCVQVELSGDLDGLRPSVDAALYRLAQESITNALRHGDHRGPIDVHLDWTGPELQLWVVNRAQVEPPKAGTGHGLAGMNERATLAGGRFGTTLVDGLFTVYASIPYATVGVTR